MSGPFLRIRTGLIKYRLSTNSAGGYFYYSTINDDLDKFVNILEDCMITNYDIGSKSTNALDAYKKLEIDEKAYQFIIYYFMISINVGDIKLAESQLNMSFQYIIYNKYEQIQIAYTGTVHMQMMKSLFSAELIQIRMKIWR